MKKTAIIVVGIILFALSLPFMRGKNPLKNYSITKADKGVETQEQIQDNSTPEPEESQMSTQELKIEDIKEGDGQEVKEGDTAVVHYTGTFTNGEKFGSSKDRGAPFSFTVGEGQVIRGWDQGLLGMKVGGTRKLIVPSNLAYGDIDYGGIPGGSTLVFEIELLKIE